MRPNLRPEPEDDDGYADTVPCPDCGGDGGDEDGRCPTCDGDGWIIVQPDV